LTAGRDGSAHRTEHTEQTVADRPPFTSTFDSPDCPSTSHLFTFSQEHLAEDCGFAGEFDLAIESRPRLFRLGSKTKKTSFILTTGVSAVIGLGLSLENILLHETWQAPFPYSSSRCEQVTIRAFTAHSYMKLVPDLGSYIRRQRHVGREGEQQKKKNRSVSRAARKRGSWQHQTARLVWQPSSCERLKTCFIRRMRRTRARHKHGAAARMCECDG